MISVISGTVIRIISNSYLNVFQKLLTRDGHKPSVVNFYTYLGLFLISLFLIPLAKLSYSTDLLVNFIIMGILGALGNYFIIKALSVGELSSLAPINSYKPIVAMVIAFFYLKEIPSIQSVIGILLIITGTYILHGFVKNNIAAISYRILALIFSGSEAVFIKKVIVLTNIPASFFLWAASGLIFSLIFISVTKQRPKLPSVKYQSLLIFSVFVMQYSTNYVFSKINVSYALALFQLSTILSVFLGVNIFKENGFKRKLIASIVMVIGAAIILIT